MARWLLVALAVGVSPAQAQIPRLRDAGGLLNRVPTLSSFFESDPPITTNLDDARTEIAFLDSWSPANWGRLEQLPRNSEGAYVLRRGRFAMHAESYCMHAGTFGPGGGDGYLYAPLVGPKAGIVQSLLRNSVAHPEIPQRDIQVLIWAIIARTEFGEMPREMQQTARTLLTDDQVDDLDDGVLGLVPESVMREATSQLPPLARQVFQAEARLRSMISSGTSSFDELERVAVLTGAVVPPEDSRPVPEGRWSFDPGGYFVRYSPSGYSLTQVEVSVPAPVVVGRDASGRVVTIIDADGARLDADAGGVHFAAAGSGAEMLTGNPPGVGDRSGQAVRGVIEGAIGRPVSAVALAELGEIEALVEALRAPGITGVGATVARTEALDLLAEAWQAAFCQAAGCPSTAAANDLLVFRDGSTFSGELQGCAADSCMLGYSSFPRDAIEWIGLSRTESGPPPAISLDIGEVHQVDGEVRSGDLLGVGQRRVVTDRGGYDRMDVAWIHLVPGEEGRAADPYGGGGAPGGASGPPEPPVPPRDDPPETDDNLEEPVFDPSDDVATPGNRARQRLAQSSRPSRGASPIPGDRCAGERRNLSQAEALLDHHDLQMKLLADRYAELYDQLVNMQQEFERLHAAAQQEWSRFQNDQLFQALQNLLSALVPLPTEDSSAALTGISAAQSAIGFYQFWMANWGTIADMRAWAQANSGSYDLNDLLGMLDQMDTMYRTMGRMTQLRDEYDEMEVNRRTLEASVEEARRLLEACLAATA